MKSIELLKPRYEIIGAAPLLRNQIGEIILCDYPSGQIVCNFVFSGNVHISPDAYPLIFRQLNWWENRKIEDMPKKVKSLSTDDVYEIEKWDIEHMIGFISIKERTCCDLRLFTPEYGYIPVDAD